MYCNKKGKSIINLVHYRCIPVIPATREAEAEAGGS
jgi:hypothetical protein